MKYAERIWSPEQPNSTSSFVQQTTKPKTNPPGQYNPATSPPPKFQLSIKPPLSPLLSSPLLLLHLLHFLGFHLTTNGTHSFPNPRPETHRPNPPPLQNHLLRPRPQLPLSHFPKPQALFPQIGNPALHKPEAVHGFCGEGGWDWPRHNELCGGGHGGGQAGNCD